MYESPINIIISKLCTKFESDCIKSVQRYGFDVDKEELAKALNYDRKQYEKGHTDGYSKAIDDFVKAIVDRGLSSNDDKYCIILYDNYLKVIKEIAEQLKAGGKNEQS